MGLDAANAAAALQAESDRCPPCQSSDRLARLPQSVQHMSSSFYMCSAQQKGECPLMCHWLALDKLRYAARMTAAKAQARRQRATFAPQDALRQEAALQQLDAQAACLPLTDVL